MTVKLIFSIISLLVIIGAPIGFYLIQKKKYKIKFNFWNVVAGILIEFIFKYVLLNVVMNCLSNINETIYNFLATTIGYVVIDVILTVILLIGGLFIVKKIYYHNNMSLTAMVSMTLGMTIADILNSTLMIALSNLLYILKSNDGTLLEALAQQVSNEQALTVIESYNAMPADFFLYAGVITFAMLASNYLTMALFCHSNMETHKVGQLILLTLIIGIYTTVYYFDSPATFAFANPVLLIFAGLQLVFAHVNAQYMIFIENEKKK